MKLSRYLFICIGFAVFVAVFFRFEEYVVRSNFSIFTLTSCDSTSEACFVADCAEEDDACDMTPYKKVQIAATAAPACAFENECDEIVCLEEDLCVVTYCSDSSLEEGERCFAGEKETSE